LQRELGLPGVHAECRHGKHDDARYYCTKEESRVPGSVPIEIGDPPTQGQRTDLDHLRDVLKEHGLREAFERDFTTTVRYWRGFEKYLSLVAEPRTRDTPQECYYFYGAQGTGKTRAVWETIQDDSRVYPVPTSSAQPWFDNYRPGHHTVILVDDYRGQWPIPFFLQFLDRYSLLLPVKGSHMPMGRAKIYVTSNEPLEIIYPNVSPVTMAALKRRFKEIKKFVAPLGTT